MATRLLNSFLTVCLGFAASAQGALTVNNGSLGLQTTPGATNHIWADAPPANTVFDRWVGDTSVLADPLAWHTTAVTPAAAAVITATYKSAPAWSPSTYILNGLASTNPNAVKLSYYFPPNPVGVIFRFHGSGGSADSLFNKVEDFTFARDAVAAGYAIVSLDSTDRVNKQWDSAGTAANVDVVNVQAAINYFIGLGLMTTDTPKFSTGMSDGGGFAPKPAYYLGFRACSLFCSSGQPAQIFTLTTVPTIWSLARNDDLFDHTTFLQNATANLASLNAQRPSVTGELRENLPSPVYPRRFLRIPGLTAANSQAIYGNLKSGGFLDAEDFLVANPATSGWASSLPAGLASFQGDILSQLNCCYSAHQFYSDFNDKVLQFFGVTTPGRLVNVSTRARVETGASVMIGGFVVGGAAGTTTRIIVRAVGPSLSAVGLTGVLANPTISLYDASSALIESNDDWQTQAGMPADAAAKVAAIQSSGLAPTNPLESALIRDLAPGAYTAIVSGVNATAGIGLVEAYDLDSLTAPAQPINLSTRAKVQDGSNVVIAGIAIRGAPLRVLFRALGPSLAASNVPNVLPDPTMTVLDSSGQVIATNNNWQDPQSAPGTESAAAISATTLAPSNPSESAILILLPAGNYTAIISGTPGSNLVGNAIVEVYALP